MPLSNATLLQELVDLGEHATQPGAARAWGAAYAAYAQQSTALSPTPGIALATATSVIVPALAGLPSAGSSFYSTLAAALMAFWTTAIPSGTPGAGAVLVPPGLAELLEPPSRSALAARDRVSALTPIANTLHTWALTISYTVGQSSVPLT